MPDAFGFLLWCWHNWPRPSYNLTEILAYTPEISACSQDFAGHSNLPINSLQALLKMYNFKHYLQNEHYYEHYIKQ